MADPSQVMLAAAQQVPLGRARQDTENGYTSVAIRKFPQNLAII